MATPGAASSDSTLKPRRKAKTFRSQAPSAASTCQTGNQGLLKSNSALVIIVRKTRQVGELFQEKAERRGE